MNRFSKLKHKVRGALAKAGSLLMLFQRAPLVKMLFPEAKLLADAGLGETIKWTATIFAGLGAYDTVAGASGINQLTPTLNATTVNVAQGATLSFTFQVTGTLTPAKSWSISGALPAGLTHNGSSSSLDSITGKPTQTGTFRITVTAWENPGFSGFSLSQPFTINVLAPLITTQPQSTVAAAGDRPTLTVVTSGTGITYQWYNGTSGTTTSKIANATSASYLVPPVHSTNDFWVQVTRGTQVENSATATVTLGTAPKITTQPASSTAASGATVTLTTAASGTTPAFQWYQGASGVTTNPVAGATSATFTTPALTTTTSFWVRASNSLGNSDSQAAVITVGSAPAFTTQPASTSVSSGATATLTAAVSGDSPTFQWFQGASGVTTTPISGATSGSFTTPALTAATSYWVRATNSFGSADSTTANVTIGSPFASWQGAHFNSAQLANTAISGPDADPDGDGIKNSDEYVLGSNPLVSDGSILSAVTSAANQYTISFTARAASGTGYEGETRHYALETTFSLTEPSWSAITGFEDIVATGQAETYTAPVLHNSQFYRVRVWLTP